MQTYPITQKNNNTGSYTSKPSLITPDESKARFLYSPGPG